MAGFCSRCGNSVEGGKAFCSACGNRVENYYPEGGAAPVAPRAVYAQPQYGPPVQAPRAVYAQPPRYSPPKKKPVVLLILSAVLLFLTGAVLALTFILSPYNAKPKELNGEWDVTLKLESVLNEAAGYAAEESVGDVMESRMLLSLDKNGEGEAMINGLAFGAAYEDGKIVAKGMMDERMQISLTGALKKDGEEFIFTGAWKYTLMKGQDKGDVVRGVWSAVLVDPGAKGSPD